MAATRSARTLVALACASGALALLLLLLVLVPFALFEPFAGSERLTQAHALLWLAFFSPLTALPSMGHWMDRLMPLASDDPRIALIPQFVLMFVLWSALFFAIGLLWRTLRRRKER